MDVIHYAGGQIRTGSKLAHAVLAYGRALAENDTSDMVELPIYNEDGSIGRAELLIGPASQLVAEQVPDDREDLADSELLAKLDQSTRALEAPRPMAVDKDAIGEFPDLGEI
jgi:hypothetical protein